MKHRHLNHDDLTLAAIDSIIERGHCRDWRRLAHAIRDEAGIAEKVCKLTAARLGNVRDDELDRDLFSRWLNLAQARIEAAKVNMCPRIPPARLTVA